MGRAKEILIKVIASKPANDFIKKHQLRYIYFLHPNEKENLTGPILPFSKIDEMGAGMYKGEKRILCRDVVNASTNSISEVAG